CMPPTGYYLDPEPWGNHPPRQLFFMPENETENPTSEVGFLRGSYRRSIVLQSDGETPATDATVSVCGDGFHFSREAMDSEGRFSVVVPPGSQMTVNAEADIGGGKTLVVTAPMDESADVSVTLAPWASLSGTITFNREPVEGILMSVDPQEDGYRAAGESATTDA